MAAFDTNLSHLLLSNLCEAFHPTITFPPAVILPTASHVVTGWRKSGIFCFKNGGNKNNDKQDEKLGTEMRRFSQINYNTTLTAEELESFYLVHEKFLIMEGISNYFDWWAVAKREAPQEAEHVQTLLQNMNRLIPEFRRTGGRLSEIINAIQDWYVASSELNEKLKTRGLL